MPKLNARKVPSYRFHKQSGQAIVTLSGKDHLLGPYGSPESKAKYDRLIAEWLANGRRSHYRSVEGLTLSRVLAEFWAHVKSYYVTPEGKLSSEAENFRQALIPLRRLYGATMASEFGPRALKALQQEMIRLGWCRTHINRQTARLKQVFKWAVAQELIPPTIYQGLATVPGLRKGKSEAREADPVKPVPEAWVEATILYVSRQVATMIRLQLLTGMRPGEMVIMRPQDIEMRDDAAIWIYRPAFHKTEHHGHSREVRLGPKAQAIIQPFLTGRPVHAYLFSPTEVMAERRAARHAARKTPLSYGNAPGSNVQHHPMIKPGDHYTVGSYRKAIIRACDRAFPLTSQLQAVQAQVVAWRQANAVPEAIRKDKKARGAWRKAHPLPDDIRQLAGAVTAYRSEHQWHPHQLRHNAATRLRRDYGIEAARIILGHRSAAITEMYAEADLKKASQIMGEVG